MATCECQNCDWQGDEDHVRPIKRLLERVAPGEPMPAGECPLCGCLCHLSEVPEGGAWQSTFDHPNARKLLLGFCRQMRVLAHGAHTHSYRRDCERSLKDMQRELVAFRRWREERRAAA